MTSTRSPLFPLFLSLLLAFPIPLKAESKPVVAVPPFGEGANEKARAAVIRTLRDTGRVTVIESAVVDRYLAGLAPKGTQKTQSSSIEEGTKLLEKGQQAYTQLKVKEATDLLFKAKDWFRNHLTDEGAFEGLRAAQFHLAMAYLAGKDSAKAKEEIKEVIVLDPERDSRTLSAKLYPPDIRKLVDGIRADIRKREHGDLEVVTRPAGALIYVDGRSAGASPARVRGLPAGEHFIRAQFEGSESQFTSKFVVSGENRIELELRPVQTADVSKNFETVNQSQDIDHHRAAFLDQAGLALGADIFLLVSPSSGAVKAQFYDQRSQEVSRPQSDTTPEGLVGKLVQDLDANGYVIAAEETAKKASPLAPPLVTQTSELQPPPTAKGTLTNQPEQPLLAPNRPGERRLWYENPWIWAAVGGVLLVGAGSALLFTDVGKSDATTSTLTLTVPGR
ncbi:MAG TPA: PEGA domain-containing protein [Bdellovibrionota bacterium]|nr:PEGA domain-containing protein [Bdellovibrionota bacterium]